MKKTIYARTLFMILIILAMPVYVSKAYAADELVVKKYSGDDNVDGYFQTYDRWLLEVDAKLDSDSTITAQQVKINGINFDSCFAGTGGYTSCSYTGDYFGGVPPDTYPATFTLHSDTGQALVTESKEMAIDNLAPLIELTATPIQTSAGMVVPFEIKDRAYIADDFTECSGIKRVEIWDGSNKIYENILNTADCTYSESATTSRPSSSTVIIKAYDRMDQFATLTVSQFIQDNDAPIILGESFTMFRDGVEVGTSITGQTFIADIQIAIEDSSIVASGARADFSNIGGSSDDVAENCFASGAKFICEWNNVPVSVTSASLLSITFNIEDTFGNSAEITITPSFSTDSTSPFITYIGTEADYEGVGYIGNVPTNIVMRLTDTGSGLSAGRVNLDLSGVNPAYGGNVQADECVESSGEWICRWFDKVTTKQHGVSVEINVVEAKDNAGNRAQGPGSATLVVDKQSPVISVERIEAIGVLGVSETIASGDEVRIIIEGTDESGVDAVGDLVSIYDAAGATNLAADCTQVGSDFECVWDIYPVKSGYLMSSVPLSFIDTAGNVGVYNVEIEVFPKALETNPDYWSVNSIEVIPEAIDRQAAAITSTRAYARVELHTSSNAEIAEVNAGSCYGGTAYLLGGFPELLNGHRGTTDPYLKFNLEATDAYTDYDNLTFNCTLEIISIYNNQLSNIEFQEILVTIPFYNLPIGEASDSLTDKIEDGKDEWIDGWGPVIDPLRDIIRYSKTLCSLSSLIADIRLLLDAGFGWAAAAGTNANAIPYAGTAIAAEITESNRLLCRGNSAFATGSEATYEFANNYCKFINCQIDPEFGEGTGWSFIGSWRGAMSRFMDSKMDYGVFPELGRLNKDPGNYLNSKDSIVGGILTACIPGIVNGLVKYREIQCMYIDCLETGAAAGTPTSACNDMKGYAECKFIYGEIFQLLPFVQFINYYLETVRDILTDPLRIAGVALALGCKIDCSDPGAQWDAFLPHQLCETVSVISLLGEITGQLYNLGDEWEQISDDDSYCKKID
ncbi:MAG: hypothetical protein V3V78_05315 [Candidatus Woesearchaeota archaeon]